jgi:hypothetical protein
MMLFTSENSIKELIYSISNFWDKNALLRYSKDSKNIEFQNSLVIGYLNEIRINVKKEFTS